MFLLQIIGHLYRLKGWQVLLQGPERVLGAELLPLLSSQTYCLLQCLVQDQQLYSHLFLMMMTIVRIEGCEMMISFFPSAYLSTHFSMLFFSKVLVSFLHCSIFSSILSHSRLAGRYFSIISVFHFSSLRRSVPSSIKFLMDSA